MAPRRPASLCRSWLFVEGANEAVLQRAPQSGPDVRIHELERKNDTLRSDNEALQQRLARSPIASGS